MFKREQSSGLWSGERAPKDKERSQERSRMTKGSGSGSPVSCKPSISHTHGLLPGLPYSPVKQILTAPHLHFQAHTLQSPLFSEEETEVLRGSDFPKAPQDICGSYLVTQGTQLDKGWELQRALQAWVTRCPSGLEQRSAPESPRGPSGDPGGRWRGELGGEADPRQNETAKATLPDLLPQGAQCM